MGVLLQGFYKKKPNLAVPSPADGNVSVPWWWDHLAAQASALRQAGFTAIWLPPVLKTSAGASSGADGYGPFDDYDIGSRNQKGTTPTRFGAREQLQRCVATLRANGLDVYVDMVEHHRIGDVTPFVFRYPGADNTPDAGRFPKNPTNFVPIVPRDPDLGGPVSDDKAFGRELAPIDAKPAHYVFDNLIAAADWLTRALDIQGYRIDDAKGLSTDFLRPFLESESMTGKFAVGEYFDGNRVLINNWIFNPRGMNGRSSAFDFPLKFVLTQMCNNAGQFNMAALDHVGLTGISPLSAVTFVENHDTDLNGGQSIISNKLMGYAYVLTSEGYPCVYYRDYDMGPDGYKLKPEIDNLIWIHEKLAAGPTQQRFMSFDVFAYERLGGPRLLVGLNNSPDADSTITVATGFGPNKALHDYTGHRPDIVTDGNGNATITIPKNVRGLGYVCYSVEGQGGGFNVAPQAVTQVFEGAADLDILPAINGQAITAGRVWCAANSVIRLNLKPDTTGWTNTTSILLELLAPGKIVLVHQVLTLNTLAGAVIEATTQTKGFHTLQLTVSNAPAGNPKSSYKLSVTYTAPPTFDLASDVASASTAAAGDPAKVGVWEKAFQLPNVPIHAHLLPTKKLLFWGRRNPPATTDFASLNQHETHAFIWDPGNPAAAAKPTGNEPTDSNNNKINLFCSAHTFLGDGRLLVTGGHLFDSQGIPFSTVYDCFTDRWSAGPVMNTGRWYPSAVTLPDGRAFVAGGSFALGTPASPPNAPDTSINNRPQAATIPQVPQNGAWVNLADFDASPGKPKLSLFPRFHVVPDGSLFLAGTNATTYFLKGLTPGQPGTWVQLGRRTLENADYAPSVMYEPGKIVYIGGGGGDDAQPGVPPSNVVEVIDLTIAQPAWTTVKSMKFGRRQHNATLLPDGTVLVTGGSQGHGFDNLGQSIHVAELWDPSTGDWTQLAPEGVDRCYHSTAVLLPDGKVFSGGGGEYAPNNQIKSNDPNDTHSDAQLFSPPYLFKSPQPKISKSPENADYGSTFEVETPAPGAIGQVTLLRLSSVTHSFNMDQRINFLVFTRGADRLTVTAPANSNLCPPGYYMLFILNQDKVPSVASMIRIGAAVGPALAAHVIAAAAVPAAAPALAAAPQPLEEDALIQQTEKKPAVVVGVTTGCPYGLSACWGGAYEALSRLPGVRLVRPLPNAGDSTAFVYLKHDGLPDLEAWTSTFEHIANGTHHFRGVEVTEGGLVTLVESGHLVLQGNDTRPIMTLYPMNADDKIQWDAGNRVPKPTDPQELQAWQSLEDKVRTAGGSLNACITGPLKKAGDGYVLEVRQFSLSAVEKPACCGGGQHNK